MAPSVAAPGSDGRVTYAQSADSYGFSCITVRTVMQENLPCEPHAVRCRVSCIMAVHNHNARNSIGERSPVAPYGAGAPARAAAAGSGVGAFSTVTADTHRS